MWPRDPWARTPVDRAPLPNRPRRMTRRCRDQVGDRMQSPSPHGLAAPARRSNGTTAADVSRLLPIDAATKTSVRILVIDDERTLRDSCATALRFEGYQVETCGRGEEALETLRAGAWDYLPKPFTGSQLQVLVGRATHTVLVGRETRALRESGTEEAEEDGPPVLGVAPACREAIALARRVATTDASVFITGESGSGKEMIAQFIHRHSRRASRPLIAVNCAALPEALLESEMFGHVKGAFTGAVRDKPGLLEMANGGTLLLDELIEMSKPIQAKLLRAIQDGVVRRVGSEHTDAVVNVRFIACTNCNPEEALRSGQLREDLYYRLRVVPIQVPPLRDRPEDIPLLANHFLAYYWRRHREGDAPLPKLADAAVRELRSRPWKGNVRELQNVIEHMVVLLRPGVDVQPEDIPVIDGPMPTEDPDESASAIKDADNAIAEGYRAARERLLGRFERRFLQQLVTQADGNVSRAARIARLNRTTLYRLMERYGLQRKLLASDLEEPEE